MFCPITLTVRRSASAVGHGRRVASAMVVDDVLESSHILLLEYRVDATIDKPPRPSSAPDVMPREESLFRMTV